MRTEGYDVGNRTMFFSRLTQKEESAAAEMSDEALLHESVARPALFAELVTRYQGAFLRKARAVVHTEEEAEDVVQETFMKMYQYADRFTPAEGGSVKAWGYAILLNTAYTRYRRLQKERTSRTEMDEECMVSLPDRDMRQFEREEVRDYVVSVLARMPDHFARVLTLYFLERKSQKEIAALEHTTVGAIKTRMHRAKREFRLVAAQLTPFP